MCSYELVKLRSTEEFVPNQMVSGIPTPANPDMPVFVEVNTKINLILIKLKWRIHKPKQHSQTFDKL